MDTSPKEPRLGLLEQLGAPGAAPTTAPANPVVVEEAGAPRREARPSRRAAQLLCFSGMTESSARAIAAGLAGALSSHGREELADAAFTLACGQRVVLPTHAFESQDGASAKEGR
ncbi:MAG: hypothetical protein ABSB49_21090 [Polyangia bacterium]